MTGIALDGIVDMHCHYGPDFVHPGLLEADAYAVSAPGAVREARDDGQRAVVIKSHDFPTAALANALDEIYDGIRVFGGIALDHPMGGLNVRAVEAALRVGAKIVWLPTISSHQDMLNGVAAAFGYPDPGLRVLDDDGELLEATREIAALVREHGAILATGHISAQECFAVTRAFAADTQVLITHAGETLAGAHLTCGECVELADLGATVEIVALTCLGHHPGYPQTIPGNTGMAIEDMAALVQAVGPQRVVMGSDLGFSDALPHPATAMRDHVAELWRMGATEPQLATMACAVPARLLGLE